MTTTDTTKAIAYIRVSTEEQGASGLGVEAQEAAIRQAIDQRGWQLGEVIVDAGVSGGTPMRDRTGGTRALALLEGGDADALVVAKLDRVSRSVVDFVNLMDRSAADGWGLVLLDLDLDTTRPTGRFVATIMAAVAELERGFISQRTKAALAAKKARGERLGRPSNVSPELRRRIEREHANGMSLRAIARELNADEVSCPGGGSEWRHAQVRSVLDSQAG